MGVLRLELGGQLADSLLVHLVAIVFWFVLVGVLGVFLRQNIDDWRDLPSDLLVQVVRDMGRVDLRFLNGQKR